jgi:multicomponent Na+:H+ antiporter subunit B
MIEGHGSVVVVTFVRILAPLAQTFALYVLVHGHDSPGGGFQAGVVFGASHLMLRLALGPGAPDERLDETRWLALAAAGVLLYVAVGAAGFGAGAFLDYAALPAADPVRARWVGILLIETGVGVAVAATLVVIFRRLAAPGPDA